MKQKLLCLVGMLPFFRHGRRCLAALGGVFVSYPVRIAQKLLYTIAAGMLLLCTCSGGGSDTATISINLNTESMPDKATVSLDELRHVVTLSGPTGKLSLSISGRGTAKATVAPGLWHIEVEAFYGNDLYAIGSGSAEVKAGKNTSVTIFMSVVRSEGGAVGGGGGGGGVGGGSPPGPSITVTDPSTALTTMFDGLYNELSVPFTLTVSGLGTGETIDIDINSTDALTYGLSLPASAPVTLSSNGPASITLTYDGSTPITAPMPVSVGLDVTLPTGLPGNPLTLSVEIYDGTVATRPIPVTEDNIYHFNVYANDTSPTGGLSKHYKLMEDVVLSGGPNSWTTIGGTGSSPFDGTFDGNGKTISNLNFNNPGFGNLGLFGRIVGDGSTTGIVKNLGVSGTINITTTNLNIGGVVGWINTGGQVLNCYSSVNITAGGNYVGGVAGQNQGKVQNCYSTGSVSSVGTQVGGVAGYNNGGTVEYCYSTGIVSGNSQVGGVVRQNTAPVQFCVALNPSISDPTSTGASFGRVTATNSYSTSNCYARNDMEYVQGGGSPTTTFPGHNTATKDGADITSWNPAWFVGIGFTDPWWTGKLPTGP